MCAALRAFLEHADARLDAPRSCELTKPTRRREPGRAGADDSDLELENLSLQDKTCASKSGHCNIASRSPRTYEDMTRR